MANNVIVEAQKKITAELSSLNSRITKEDAEQLCSQFASFADDLQAEVQVKLEELITGHVHKNASELLDEYKKKITELAQEINVGEVSIDPFELMEGDISGLSNIEFILKDVEIKEKEWEVVGNHKNYKETIGLRRWLNRNIGTSFDVDYEIVNDYDWVEHTYIDGRKLAERFFAPIQEQLYENSNNAVEYAKEQTKKIKKDFYKKFTELDDVLKRKLRELEECANNQKDVERRIRESQSKLKWLEAIQVETKAILDI